MLKDEAMRKYDKICVVGDFNYPFIKWDSSIGEGRAELIRSEIDDAFLIQIVNKPTRRREGQNPTLDDWVLISDDGLASNVEHEDPLGKSDHEVLTFNLNITINKMKEDNKYSFNLNKGNYDKMREVLRDYDWDCIVDDDIDEMWNKLKEVISGEMLKCIPKAKSKNKSGNPIWMNQKAMRSIKKKYNSYKRFLRSKTGYDYLKYIKDRNQCTKSLKQARKDYERNIAKNSKTNPKQFWKYIQNKIKINAGIGTLRKPDGSIATSDQDKADTLNSFFASVFTKEDIVNMPVINEGSYSNGSFLSDLRVTPEAVRSKLSNLKPDKAQGPDKIPPRVLKELSNELSEPIALLFNKSLEEGKIPSEWKMAEVTAIFKKGCKSEPGNYRPVSLTCVLCKVLESLVRDVVVSHFAVNNLYANCQHGFRERRSCVTQLIEFVDRLTALTEEGEPIDIIYLDFKKAFDSVPHGRLLSKLAAYGITGRVLKWIEDFLSDRVQCVRIGNAKSGKEKVLSGIPQGSILGPILFTIFINDIPEGIESFCHIFADDTKLYNAAKSSDKLQRDIFKLQEWSVKWNLYFNVTKCHVMHVGRKNPKYDYEMKILNDVQIINKCNEEKDLGVVFDSNLSFDPHIRKIAAKANQVIGMVRRAFSFVDKDTFLKLYKAFVRPHLEYANVIWAPYLKRQSRLIESVQRRATRILPECEGMSYSQRLKYLKLHSLKGRRMRGDLIQTYKIMNNKDDIDLHSLFILTNPNTRNNEGKLYKKYAGKNIRKFSFSHRVVNSWNNLPTHVKFAKSTNEFKTYVDTILANQNFYQFD